MDTACYSCTAQEERTCEVCHRPICRACAGVWPMYQTAVNMRLGTCKACFYKNALRSLEEARELLRADGIEPRF